MFVYPSIAEVGKLLGNEFLHFQRVVARASI